MGTKQNRFTLAIASLLAAGLLSLGSAGAAATSDTGVGVIGRYRPAAARYVLTRSPKGEKVPVQIGAVVMAGDRLALPANASVTVQLANNETLNLKGPGEFVIPDARPLGKLAVIFQSLRPILLDDEYRLDGTAASRGGNDQIQQLDRCLDTRGRRHFLYPAALPRRIVRRFSRDRHIMDMAFGKAGIGDPDELCPGAQILDRGGSGIAHGGLDPAH